MAARGMAADIEPLGIAIEAFRIRAYPRDGATHLRRQYAQVSARVPHRGEINGDKMRPGVDKHLGGVGAIPCRAVQPDAAMDEDEDRCPRPTSPIDVERFDPARSVGHALGFADARTHLRAVGDKALVDPIEERLVSPLVIRRVELDLIVVHENERTLVVRGGPNLTLSREKGRRLGQGRWRSQGGACGEQAPAGDVAATRDEFELHLRPPGVRSGRE